MNAMRENTVWTLSWPHGEAEVQSLGGMLAPVTFTLDDGRPFQPMHVAPWANDPSPARSSAHEAATARLPGILQRLRGEWPCVPFGRDDRPRDLPSDWHAPAASAREDKKWGHGYGAHHHWHLVDQSAGRLHIAIDYPAVSAIRRLEREIIAVPGRPALDIILTIFARRAATLPVALHPVFRLPKAPGGVILEQLDYECALIYPVPAEPGTSRLEPGAVAIDLGAMPGLDGPLNLTRLPLPFATEELLQLRDCRAPIVLHYLEERAHVGLWWDQRQLPDVMLWLSNGGRKAEPWGGRHYALGVEPVNGAFDLGQVAMPPAGHPLSQQHGLALSPDQPRTIQAQLAAW
ncbi:MAG TPA: hypothetical protein VM639_01475 [Dongiaceae bacterium]|nr:hypothetical protein [Dongiaceae bacterium]